MKSSIAVAAIAAVASAQQIISDSIYKSAFGAITEETVYDNKIVKNVTFPSLPYAMDYVSQTENLVQLTQKINAAKGFPAAQTNDQELYTCDNRLPIVTTDSFSFFPVWAGVVSPSETHITFTGHCFDFDVTYEPVSDTSFDLSITTSNKKSQTCSDNVFFGNTEIRHIESFYFGGDHKITFNIPANGVIDLDFGGLKMFYFCSGIKDEIISLFKTVESFVGGVSDHPFIPYIGSHTPPYMEKANLDFIKASMELTIEERPIYEVDVPADYIQSGDFFLIMRLDGLDPMIMYGTGSHGAHCVQALRFDGELYIVESQDAWYWPTAGIQRTPYHKWIKQAKEASFNVIWLPMSAKSMLKFDEKKANEWFFQTEGLPYGYHNFIYGWMDTTRDNLPRDLPNELAPIVFSMLEYIIPTPVYNLFIQGMNKRIGSDCTDMPCVATQAALKMMSIQDVMAIPEQDGWIYTGLTPRDGMAYVCSAYSASVYKAAGMFDNYIVQATEFTPRDVYMLDFFDKEFKRPQICIDADPNLPYCQLIGKYRLDITKEWSVIKPYAHMNEHCPSVGPDYFRPEGC